MTSHPRRMMAAMFLPLFAALLSISIVNVALPAIEAGLGASDSDLQWVLSGYALAFGVALVPAGRAGDVWGRRRFFLLGVIFFGLASLLTALAPDPLLLNIARVLMGIGAGILTPQIIGMIQRLFTGSERGRAYGLMSTVIGLAVAAGPALGGLIIDTTSPEIGWRLTFLINVPVTAAALLFAMLWLPRPEDDDAGPQAQDTAAASGSGLRGIHRLDPVGVLLLSAAVVLIMLPFIQFRSLFGAALGVLGAAVLLGWVLWEKRLGQRHAGAPMVNLALFTVPSYTLNSLVLGLYFTGMPAIWAIVAVYVQQGLGEGALIAGLVTLPSALMVMLLSASVGKRVAERGTQLLVWGTVLSVVAMLAVAGAAALMSTDYGSLWLLTAAVAVVGLSQALIIPSAQTLSMQDVPERMAGAAGGVAQTAQRVCTAVGVALITGIYFTVSAHGEHQDGLVVGALGIAVFMVSSVAAAVFAARRARRAAAAA